MQFVLQKLFPSSKTHNGQTDVQRCLNMEFNSNMIVLLKKLYLMSGTI